MESSNFKAFVPEPELRAFLYQQIQELEAFMDGAVVLMLDRSEDKKMYRVNIVLAPGPDGVRLQVTADNAFTALSVAKQQAKEVLSKFAEVSDKDKTHQTLH